MSDLISRKYVVSELLKEREHYPPMVAERYSFGVKLPHRFNQAMRGGIRKALRIAETAPAVDAVEVVRCRDCLNCGMNASIKYDGYRDDVRLCMLHGIAILPDDYCSGGVKADVEVGSDD